MAAAGINERRRIDLPPSVVVLFDGQQDHRSPRRLRQPVGGPRRAGYARPAPVIGLRDEEVRRIGRPENHRSYFTSVAKLTFGGSCRGTAPAVLGAKSTWTGVAPPPHRAGKRAAGTPAPARRPGRPVPRHPRTSQFCNALFAWASPALAAAESGASHSASAKYAGGRPVAGGEFQQPEVGVRGAVVRVEATATSRTPARASSAGRASCSAAPSRS